MNPARESHNPSAMKTVRRVRNEALGCGFSHFVFAFCIMAFVGLWMIIFYFLDMFFPTKSPAGKTIVAILQIVAIVTSYGGGWLATRWLGRQALRSPSSDHSSPSAASGTFRVARWIPQEKKFEYVGDAFSELAQARERAAIERLHDPYSQFAVLDQNKRMVENEAGRLLR